ncbi:MAG TPA: M23 family metallopeptidase, partial [Pyrinomonadaceae bacterium]|nr:M23 family metallopeptidase [Pyrinomonadaceae bacterium]
MADFGSVVRKTLLIVYIAGIHIVLGYMLIDKFVIPRFRVPNITSPVDDDPTSVDLTEPTPGEPAVPQSEVINTPAPPTHYQLPKKVIVPVRGVTPEQLIDTFNDPRGDERAHNALDIAAPAGTPVIAAVDGEIVKFHDSAAGGLTIYQISTDKKYFFYYAHLQRRSQEIAEKQFVTQGTVIGYVGDTGNAGVGNY